MIQKKCREKLYQFRLNKAVVLLRKYLNSVTLSCYKDDLDIYEDSKSDNRSSISEEVIGVEEEDSAFILSANEYLSLGTKVSADAELARTFVLEDCVIFLLNVVKCACFLKGGVLISILIGYALINFKYTKTINLHEICNHVLPMFCRAIEIGNYLYDCNGAFGFLHVEEGINSFSELMNLRIVNKFNLHLSSDQEYSLMLHRHQKIKISPK